jgi:pSer/pThr/pTyr-binding forkhead associated (FHA) protein
VTTDIVTYTREKLGLSLADTSATNTFGTIPALSVPVPKLPRIVVTYRGKKQDEIEIGKDRIMIGRAQENDVCIESPFISRKHAAIIRDGVSMAVIDLDSQNGTYANSRKIRMQTMNHQDEIKVGCHTIRFLDSDSPTRVSVNGIRKSRSARPRYTGSRVGAASALSLMLGELDAH